MEDEEDTRESDTKILSKHEAPQVGESTMSDRPKSEHKVVVLNRLKSPHMMI